MIARAVRVREAVLLSPRLRRLVLEPDDGAPFPAAAAGAHVLLELRAGSRTHRRAYSLAALPQRWRYDVIVRHVAQSRGGSTFLHEAVREGDVLAMHPPQNLFPLPRLARRHVLLSAGVGITPFLAYLPALAAARIAVHLHQFCRADEAAVFEALLADHAPHCTIHAGRRADLADLLTGLPIGTHVSLCGPEPFMAAAHRAALGCGFAPGKIHRESFAGAAPGTPFVAVLASNGRRIEVGAETSLLEALEAAGLDPPSLCRGGVCGQCRMGVLAGTPEHRDHVLPVEQRARGDAIIACLSRAITAELVLDL